MIQASAQVIASDGDHSVVEFDQPGCAGCHNGCKTKTSVSLPFPLSGQLHISLPPADQFACILHSLLLPLAGFVTGAVVFYQWFGTDAMALAGAAAGLSLAACLCKAQTFARLQIHQEVKRNDEA